MIIINNKDLNTLTQALLYLSMTELKEICEKFELSCDAKKGALIRRILAFIKTGEKLEKIPIPAVSKAKKSQVRILGPKELILHGSYKNDAATREFFKKLIGEHFHFTAFGVDWIEERWMAGNPPTYQEYAEFWQKEYAERKKRKATPKEEWAYINFMQRFMEQNPHAAHADAAGAWHEERQKQVGYVKNLLKL